MKNTLAEYMETMERAKVNPETHQIEGTPLYDFLSWARSNKVFMGFAKEVRKHPKSKIAAMTAHGPTGQLNIEWFPDREGADRLDIEFANGRPLARSQRERIYHSLIEE